MKDDAFKRLLHCLGSHHIVSCGNEVTKGYKPDITVASYDNQLSFIIECETGTNRKAFLGDLVKAEKYAEDCRAHPVLVIVVKEASNTTVKQIANHLTPYALWLARLNGGELNLSDILLISDQQYQRSLEADELLGSQGFRARALSVKGNSN